VEKFVRFYDSEFGRKIAQLEAEYICKELRDCHRILDVGCGIGSIESNLPQLDIVGLDNSENMLKAAKKRSKAEYVQGDAENLGFKWASFDAVLYVTTLEFLPNYERAIEETYRVLMFNGKLLAMILNPVSKYFRQHTKRESSYFRRVKNRQLKKIEDHTSRFFAVKTKYARVTWVLMAKRYLIHAIHKQQVFMLLAEEENESVGRL
jgi:ubiquinone/menaquinone biosynthesis C-methylase UbiE